MSEPRKTIPRWVAPLVTKILVVVAVIAVKQVITKTIAARTKDK